MNRKFEILGKQVSVTLVALLIMAGLGSAGLLSFYGQSIAIVTVQQAITVDGDECADNYCSYEMEAVGSEMEYGEMFYIISNTENDLKVRFSDTCSPDCEGITITDRPLLDIVGFSSGDGFDPVNYKKSYYVGTSTIDDLESIEYSFNIDVNEFSSDSLAPYIVLVSSAFLYDVAVSMIPDGGTYNTQEEYLKTIDDETLFHIPGDGTCTQGDPCTLSDIKDAYDGDITRVIVAAGAWPESGDPRFAVFAGISKINGEQAEHEYFTLYGLDEVGVTQRFDFAPNIEADTYTITTQVIPVLD